MNAAEQVGTSEAEVREVVARRAAAMRAGSPEAIVALYTADAVSFDLDPPLQHTAPRLLDPSVLRRWFAGFEGPVDIEVRDLKVTVGEDIAFCHCLQRLSATPKGTTEPFDLWFRATACLRKVAGTWCIAHEHSSTPFKMDGSFKAAIDLTP